MEVQKRNKSIQSFQVEKVYNAIHKAFEACGQEMPGEIIEKVVASCEELINPIDVEDIQDIIEYHLMKSHYDVFKAFVVYRAEHKAMREEKDNLNGDSLMKRIVRKLLARNVVNQNANLDEKSFSGRVGEAAAEATKEAALKYLMSKKARKAHINNEIYQHDLDHWFVGCHNCITLPLDDLFRTGFRVKQTDVRPPKSISTAMQLVAVLFQVQSLQQFGGVACSHLDWTMVPYVRISFFKYYAMEYIVEHIDDYCEDILALSQDDLDDLIHILRKELLMLMGLTQEDFYFGNPKLIEYNKSYYNAALLRTRLECDQAIEANYHNLNTLQSRAGAQLPFSSINFGTCTLPEGRLVIKSLLEGSIKGIGKFHKTPIFPCGIFQLMDGVNTAKGEPNYDLFRLALKSTSLRIYPNYVNCDWSNNAGYDKNDPRTYMSTMGCHAYDTLIIMSDGSFKAVQDIVIGDMVMGPDGTPRIVESLVRGCGKMYRIDQSRGESYIVNEDHILSLESSVNRRLKGVKKGGRINMSVKKYLQMSETTRRFFKGFKGSYDLPAKEYPIPPYILGLWLGDGCSRGTKFSVNKDETQIIEDLREYARTINKKLTIVDDKDENCYSVTIADVATMGASGNKMRQSLIKLNLIGNKHIPDEYFYGSKEQRSDLLAGLINSDGWGRRGRGRQTVCIGNTDLEILRGAQRLANSLGYTTNLFQARGETIGKGLCEGKKLKPYYHLSIHRFDNPHLMPHKRTEIKENTVRNFSTSKLTVTEIGEDNFYGFNIDGDRQYMLKDGTVTHNCRTANLMDVNGLGQLKDGRGNICPVTIILPTIAMEAIIAVAKRHKTTKEEILTNKSAYSEETFKEFMKLFDKKLYDAKDFLIERFEWICSQSPDSAKFMWQNNVMAGYKPEEGIRSAMKHGTLSIGNLGLAECLQLIIGDDHTSQKGMELAKELYGHYKKRCSEFKEEYKLNFGVYNTPAESLCHTALKKFRDTYGVIENVSDRDYFTNSMHVPVWRKISAFKKIDIESQLTGYSSAGCITYVELPSSVTNNIDALEEIVLYAKKEDVPYIAINTPIDECLDCGYRGEMNKTCPQCGGHNIEHLRRVTGYLSVDVECLNDGKQDEVEDRVEHNEEVLI